MPDPLHCPATIFDLSVGGGDGGASTSSSAQVVSSTVIADASGDFEIDVPVGGRHEVVVYAYIQG